MENNTLLSIKPKYAECIFSGEKTVELRRKCPKVSRGDIIYVYMSSPRKSLVGAFEVEDIISGHPSRMWDRVKNHAAVTLREYNTYFSQATIGYGIVVNKAWLFNNEIPLNQLRKIIPYFHPPQSFRYIQNEEINRLGICL